MNKQLYFKSLEYKTQQEILDNGLRHLHTILCTSDITMQIKRSYAKVMVVGLLLVFVVGCTLHSG